MDWNRRYLEFTGNELVSNLINHSSWRAGPVVQFRRNAFAGASGKPVNQLRGDGDAIEVGAFGGYEGKKWDASLQVVKDVNGGHKGYLTTAEAGYSMGLGTNTQLRLALESTYGSGNYMGSYFGIDRANSLRSGIKTYNADNGFRDVGVNAGLRYSLTKSWTLSGYFSYQRLVSDAEGNPVVDDEGSENQFVGAIGAIYHF